jgi:hypothetical protein
LEFCGEIKCEQTGNKRIDPGCNGNIIKENRKKQLFCLVTKITNLIFFFQMEHFIERLDTVLDNDPFNDIDWTLLSRNDYEVS